MSETKGQTLEELARSEIAAEKEHEEQKRWLKENRERLGKEMPKRFFELAKETRAAVERFNHATVPQKRISWQESAALATRDSNLNADFNFTLARDGVEVMMLLTVFDGIGRDNTYLIQGNGKVGEDRLFLRIEGYYTKENVLQYRISMNGARMNWDVSETAERVVRAVVKDKLEPLTA